MHETVEALFAPLTIRRFRTVHWPDRLWVHHGQFRRLTPITRIAQLSDLGSLLRVRGLYLSAIRPEYRSDQAQERGLDLTRAMRLYRDGCTLTIAGIHEVIPPVGRLLSELVRHLGLPPAGDLGRHRSIAYASPAREALACHFDPSANVIIQVQGRKKWRVARNRFVRDPVDVYSTRLTTRSGRLRAYYRGPLPTRIPDDAETIVMKRGSVMFLPRGYWHETEALEPSLSLNLVLHQPTWLDLWVEAMASRLRRHDKWRGLATGLWDGRRLPRQAAVRRLSEIARTWADDIGDLSAEEAARLADG